MRQRGILPKALLLALTLPPAAAVGQPRSPDAPIGALRSFDAGALRLAVEDLSETFGAAYHGGKEFLERLDRLERRRRALLEQPSIARDVSASEVAEVAAACAHLKAEALLSNPLLRFDRLLLVARDRGQHGLPVNHKCNAGIAPAGYKNEIAILSPVRPGGRLETLYGPASNAYVGELDLHWDATRLLFTMPVGPSGKKAQAGLSWEIHEIHTDGAGLRQISRTEPGVDNFDGCYLPDGRIVYSSTASFHAVPCWHGKERACSIFRMDPDGSNVRQLCFDQDLDLHPSVLETGQVIFSRWDYTGTMHMYLRPLIAMNPDGTNQRAVYGTNSYWPNALYFPRAVPGHPGRVVAIAAGYHGPPRMGLPVLVDTQRGWRGADGVLQSIPGRNRSLDGAVKLDEWYARTWPKFLHPFPLAEPGTGRGAGKYFLVAMQPSRNGPWGIYLVDVFDNVTELLVDADRDFFEPIPVTKRVKPPVIPDRVDLRCNAGTVYLHDVYAGPGLKGVPRGTIKELRVIAYHFGYPNLAGPDKVGLGGPWEVMRILGTVPVEADGSAAFRVPALTPLSFQPLDSDGKAVQLMRSWVTVMPGERTSCVGCHEEGADAPGRRPDLAMRRAVSDIEPWHGPARGFDFEREVQPVLDRYCVGCHGGGDHRDGRTPPDLRAERFHPDYRGHVLARLGADRLHPDLVRHFGGKRVRYTPAYEALLPYVRRVGIEDEVHLLVPGEYHADTSELVQMLAKGHQGVELDAEAWDRVITWIDLNAPCHGTWREVAPIPGDADRRRWELSRIHGGPEEDFETVPEVSVPRAPPVTPRRPRAPERAPSLPGWPLAAADAERLQQAAGPEPEMTLELGGGITIRLVRVPAGEFLMGDSGGAPDERPVVRACVERPFWLGACEVTNRQFRRFDPTHRSGYFMKRYPGPNGPGLDLDRPDQPAVRVSWNQAMAFCRWLTGETGLEVTLPTETEWEAACRAGTQTALSYGGTETDFSGHANLADRSLVAPAVATGGLTTALTTPHSEGGRKENITGIMEDSLFAGDIPAITRIDDGAVVTSTVGRYAPNRWGLHDMHGNAAEWTLSSYSPTARARENRTDAGGPSERKVVRGGSFRDRPRRCRSSARRSFPRWQRVHDVGFRIAIHDHRVAKDSSTGIGRSTTR